MSLVLEMAALGDAECPRLVLDLVRQVLDDGNLGLATQAAGRSLASSERRPRRTVVTIRLPPGIPRMARPRSDSAKAGVMPESIRFPGEMALASPPIRP